MKRLHGLAVAATLTLGACSNGGAPNAEVEQNLLFTQESILAPEIAELRKQQMRKLPRPLPT